MEDLMAVSCLNDLVRRESEDPISMAAGLMMTGRASVPGLKKLSPLMRKWSIGGIVHICQGCEQN
jgi:hypothetical protein